jgi:uncharacterized membrane protein
MKRSPPRRMEALIGWVLRVGVLCSVALVVLGTVVSFVHHPDYLSSPASLGPLTQPGSAPRTLAEIASGLGRHRGQAVVSVGLLVLLATPITRVALSLFLFARERDRRFTLLTAGVLGLLLLSFLLGKAGG